jgi:Lar family restriction alleviation protein
MKNIKLKDCPFCGNQPFVEYENLSGGKWHNRRKYEITCPSCMITFYGPTKKHILKQWNRRKDAQFKT